MSPRLSRSANLAALADHSTTWDIVVVGGGATGLGVAVDAAARGYRTVLLEQGDFANATSSRSTKLIHGGFRYLKQGQVGLVRESLEERTLLLKNAPHLVKPMPFVVPTYGVLEQYYYGLGLKTYDWLAGSQGVGRSQFLSRQETLAALSGLSGQRLQGGIQYFDAQFDDAGLAVALAQTAAEHGAILLNHVQVTQLIQQGGRVGGVIAMGADGEGEIEIKAKVVINATGIYTDDLRRCDNADSSPMMQLSRGVHLVLDASVFPAQQALMIPKTDDGRILFAIPWEGRVLLGTTDTAVTRAEKDPCASEDDIDYLLEHAGRYLNEKPDRTAVRSVFAGLRPLVKKEGATNTASLSRRHRVAVSSSGLVTITGGKWTIYRRMAEDAVDAAIEHAGLSKQPTKTRDLMLHGAGSGGGASADWLRYGSDAEALQSLAESEPAWALPLHERLPYRVAEVIWAVRHQMACTLEDVLSRRTRSLLLDANAASESAGKVAELMGAELGWDEARRIKEIDEFQALAKKYRVEIEL